MTMELLYWILMLLWLVAGAWGNWPGRTSTWGPVGNGILTFLLFLLLGWRVFGPPIR